MTAKVTTSFKSDTSRFVRILHRLSRLDREGVDVGFFGGVPHESDPEITIAAVATINEFGSEDGKIPERPFIRNTLAKNKNYGLEIAKETRSIIQGRRTIETAIARLGEKIRADMVEEINTGDFVPNAESTIKKKGSSKPLIDTGTMRDSITWRSSR